jgi:hypothetical protein
MGGIGKHELDRMRQASDARIEIDRPCMGCGYNLRGLPAGGRCPECGAPIRDRYQLDDPLSQMPIGVVKRFRLASWTATVCVAALIVLAVASVRPTWLSLARPEVLVALSLAWFGAVWLLTPAFHLRQAVAHGFSHQGKLRLAARFAQLGWIIAAGANLALVLIPAKKLTGELAETLQILRFGGAAIGLLGALLLCALLARLANWARDHTAENALNLAAFGIPISSCLIFLDVSVPFVGLFVGAIWVISIGAMPFGLLSLTASLTWAVHHAREFQQREHRRARRNAEHDEHVAGTIDQMDRARERRRSKR